MSVTKGDYGPTLRLLAATIIAGGRRDVGVAAESHNGRDVGGGVEQIADERPPEDMRAEACDPHLSRPTFQALGAPRASHLRRRRRSGEECRVASFTDDVRDRITHVTFDSGGVNTLSQAMLFALWVAALNFRPVTGSDFWIHLRIGQDILRTGAVPRVDDYSAVARGRPFIAHEWLGDVAIALVERVVGAGVSLLREATAFGVVALLLATLPKKDRASPVVVPLLVLSMYLIGARNEVRPELFTTLMLGGFALLVARWRRDRNGRPLAWLIPLELLWTNLHGAFLFGVVFLCAATGCAIVATVFPSAQRTDPPYSWRDVRTLAAVTAGCALVTLANPYGTNLLEHTARLALDPSFAFVRQLT